MRHYKTQIFTLLTLRTNSQKLISSIDERQKISEIFFFFLFKIRVIFGPVLGSRVYEPVSGLSFN